MADRPLPVAGDFALTVTIGESCRDQFPVPFRVRRYDVTIVSGGTYSRLHFADPAVFPAPNFACVCGRVRDEKNQLDLTFYEGTAAYIIVYQVYGEATLEDGSLRATVGGRISLGQATGGDVDCTSNDHAASLTPR